MKDVFSPLMQHVQAGGAASDPRLMAPEAILSPEQQRQHPILAGIGDVAGQMTTGENLALMGASGGLGELPGVAGKVAPRLASSVFSEETLRAAYNEIPELKAAVARGDSAQVQRILTHIVVGGAMAGVSLKHAATGTPVPATEGSSTVAALQKLGQPIADRSRQLKETRESLLSGATQIYQGVIQPKLQLIITASEAPIDTGCHTSSGALVARGKVGVTASDRMTATARLRLGAIEAGTKPVAGLKSYLCNHNFCHF